MNSKKEQLINFHKELILEVAEKLFLKNGLEKTTMDDIANESGYSKTTVYVYFQNKSHIYNLIILKSLKQLSNTIKENILSDKDYLECYYDVCFNIVEFAKSCPLYFKSILELDINSVEQEELRAEVVKIGEEIDNHVQVFLERGIEKGIIREDIHFPYTAVFISLSIYSVVKTLLDKKYYITVMKDIPEQIYLKRSFENILSIIIK